MKFSLTEIINIIKPFAAAFGEKAHDAAERAVTVPQKERQELYVGMSAEDIAKAEDYYRTHTDALSDYVVFVASRGAIDAD